LARGKYVILGDGDGTYDFRKINHLLQPLIQGADFVIGSRIKGKIYPQAMPMLHRYFGNPLTTALFNFLYGTNLSDIHSGLRAFSREILNDLDFRSNSWDYAVEMLCLLVKSKRTLVEVPVEYYRSAFQRTSHLRRHWSTPWKAGLLTLKCMIKERFQLCA
jgi:hypothetical protein